jgi:GTP cyclohydrolase II
LEQLGVKSLRLMTNNPRKINALEAMGVRVEERVPLVVGRNTHNDRYLTTKADKLGHLMQP